MPCINWQSPSTIATGNEIANKTVSAIQRRRQQTVTTKNKVEWLSTPPPRKTPFLLQFRHYLRYSGSPVETSHIHPHSRHHHFSRTSMPFRYSCLFKTWSSVLCYIRPWLRICLLLLLLSRYRPRYETSLYQWIPSGGKQSSGMNQSDIGTVSLRILQLLTEQLVQTVTPGGICLQSCP